MEVVAVIGQLKRANPKEAEGLDKLGEALAKCESGSITTVRHWKQAAPEVWAQLGLHGELEDTIRAKLWPNGPADNMEVVAVIGQLKRANPKEAEGLDKLGEALAKCESGSITKVRQWKQAFWSQRLTFDDKEVGLLQEKLLLNGFLGQLAVPEDMSTGDMIDVLKRESVFTTRWRAWLKRHGTLLRKQVMPPEVPHLASVAMGSPHCVQVFARYSDVLKLWTHTDWSLAKERDFEAWQRFLDLGGFEVPKPKHLQAEVQPKIARFKQVRDQKKCPFCTLGLQFFQVPLQPQLASFASTHLALYPQGSCYAQSSGASKEGFPLDLPSPLREQMTGSDLKWYQHLFETKIWSRNPRSRTPATFLNCLAELYEKDAADWWPDDAEECRDKHTDRIRKAHLALTCITTNPGVHQRKQTWRADKGANAKSPDDMNWGQWQAGCVKIAASLDAGKAFFHTFGAKAVLAENLYRGNTEGLGVVAQGWKQRLARQITQGNLTKATAAFKRPFDPVATWQYPVPHRQIRALFVLCDIEEAGVKEKPVHWPSCYRAEHFTLANIDPSGQPRDVYFCAAEVQWSTKSRGTFEFQKVMKLRVMPGYRYQLREVNFTCRDRVRDHTSPPRVQAKLVWERSKLKPEEVALGLPNQAAPPAETKGDRGKVEAPSPGKKGDKAGQIADVVEQDAYCCSLAKYRKPKPRARKPRADRQAMKNAAQLLRQVLLKAKRGVCENGRPLSRDLADLEARAAQSPQDDHHQALHSLRLKQHKFGRDRARSCLAKLHAEHKVDKAMEGSGTDDTAEINTMLRRAISVLYNLFCQRQKGRGKCCLDARSDCAFTRRAFQRAGSLLEQEARRGQQDIVDRSIILERGRLKRTIDQMSQHSPAQSRPLQQDDVVPSESDLIRQVDELFAALKDKNPNPLDPNRAFQELVSGLSTARHWSQWQSVSGKLKLAKGGLELYRYGFSQNKPYRWAQVRFLLPLVQREKWKVTWKIMVGCGAKVDDKARMGAADPGVSTFLTIYDSYNACIWRLGHKFAFHIDRVYAARARRAQSLRDDSSNKDDAKRHATEMLKWQARMRRQVKKLHHTAIRLIGAVFSTFFIPEFGKQTMFAKHRRISKSVTRRLVSLSHCRFRAELRRVYEKDYQCKAKIWTRTRIVVGDESYTTRPCGFCGFICPPQKANKVVKCPRCHAQSPRDDNASCNYFKKEVFYHAACKPAEYMQAQMRHPQTGPQIPREGPTPVTRSN
jgi:hypothetical protein